MSTSMAMSATTTMPMAMSSTSMPMATGTSADGMMDMMMMPMSMMYMTFYSSKSTALYSMSWQPSSEAHYAGTCIFLILFAVTYRVLLALKARQEARWVNEEFNRRYVAVAGRLPPSQRPAQDREPKRDGDALEEDVLVVRRRGGTVPPWRITTDPLRALIDTVIAGVGYLLMLAVMTMNVGYFMSVLAGIFLGSLTVGRFARRFEH